MQVSAHVEYEAEHAHRRLNQQQAGGEPDIALRDGRQEWHGEKADGEGAADDGNSFRPVMEAVLGVIGQAKQEVAKETVALGAAAGHRGRAFQLNEWIGGALARAG